VLARVQQEVDRLAGTLGRSVVINDPSVVLLCSSRHFGDEDDVRVQAMLNRVAGHAAIGHVLGQGVARWTRPGRIPAKPEIGMRARYCVPLRWRGELLGLLMVIDADDTLTPADRAAIDVSALEVAGLLLGERESAEAAGRAGEALITDLLSLDPARRAQAAATLRADGAIPARTPLGAIGLRAVPPSAGATVGAGRADGIDVDHVEVALRHAVIGADRFTGGATLAAVSGTTAAVLHTGGPGPDTRRAARQMVDAADEVAAGRFRCAAGIGPSVGALEEAWRSHRHAELAARAVPRAHPGPVVDWADLGAVEPLLRIPEPALDPTAVPPQLDALLRADSRGRLVGTLEAYLRHGGSAPAAAAALHIHRTTLHYRLDRIREITGCDLDDGETRLLLHLGLKIAQLLGVVDRRGQFLAGEQNGGAFSTPGP
jgi:hypothetical protein